MSLPNLELQTNKNVTSVDIDHITIRQSEKGLVLNVTILNANLTAYDLTGARIQFVDNKEQNKIVIDDADERIKITDAKAGKVSYTLHPQVYAATGSAWLEIIKGSDVVDTTQTFSINVLKEANLYLDNNNYVSDFEALENHFKALIKSAETTVNTQISDTKKKLQDTLNSANNQVADSKNKALAAINEAKNNATQTLTNMQNELNSYKAKYQALENQLNQDIKQINTNATNQLNDLKKAADNQRNADHTSATNQINSDHAAAEKAKNDAIASINSAKDSAIKQAQTNFTNKINSLQNDYNNWKNQRIADFNKQVQSIQDKLNQQGKDTTALNNKLDSIKAEMSKLSVDFSKIDFNNFETHDEFYVSSPGLIENTYHDTATFHSTYENEWNAVTDISDKSFFDKDFAGTKDGLGNTRLQWYGSSSVVGQKVYFHTGATVTISALFQNVNVNDLYVDYKLYGGLDSDTGIVNFVRGGFYVPWTTPSLILTTSSNYETGITAENAPKSGFTIIDNGNLKSLGGTSDVKVFATFKITKGGSFTFGFGSNSSSDTRFFISSLMVSETDHMVPWTTHPKDYESAMTKSVIYGDQDLNQYKVDGIYDLSNSLSLKNSPTTDVYSVLRVVSTNKRHNGTQELTNTNSAQKWIRNWSSTNTFTPWVSIASSDSSNPHDNLLHNTDTLTGFSGHVHNNSVGHGSEIQPIDSNLSPLNLKQMHVWGDVLGNAGFDTSFSGKLPAGNYTYSVYIRSNNQNVNTDGLRLEIAQAESFILDRITVTGTWSLFKVSFTLKNTYDNPQIMLMPQNMDIKIPGGSLWYAMPKLEMGNVATGWTTNTNDINNRIDQAGKVKKVNGVSPDGSGNINVHSQIIRGYDIAAKKDTNRKDEVIGGSWLVDGQALAPFADAINKVNGNTKLTGATDVNTLTSQGVYVLQNQGNTNTPSFFPDKRGTLVVYNFDGNAKTQLFYPVGTNATIETFAIRYWEGNHYGTWRNIASYEDLKHPPEKYADYISGTIDFNNNTYLQETKVWKAGNATFVHGPNLSGTRWGWIKTIHWDNNTTVQYWIEAGGDTYFRRGNITKMPDSWNKVSDSTDINNLQNQINSLKNKETSHVSANETDALNYSKSHPGIPVFVAG
ncbi:DUF2479 domain-containing protein [Lactobacillus sp. PV037]|uniref:hypothetical protein n=1 Tax=Lactobacillus sp. PV037 TaxID=2594496 RepID=UPI00223EA260|nr:hypothetical protein [Lactobacillus sp. PV037]QNQ83750.1 DUF2479 domain-containing protein [Lactobacillus sp. PV037]